MNLEIEWERRAGKNKKFGNRSRHHSAFDCGEIGSFGRTPYFFCLARP
jgi:hypothetical protein